MDSSTSPKKIDFNKTKQKDAIVDDTDSKKFKSSQLQSKLSKNLYKNYDSLNQDNNRSNQTNMAGPVIKQQSQRVAPIINIKNLDGSSQQQVIDQSKSVQIDNSKAQKNDNIQMRQQANFKQQKFMQQTGQIFEKQLQQQKNDEQDKLFNNQINNENSLTLFDKSLQNSSSSSSYLEPFSAKEFQKQNEMITNRRLVSAQKRESLLELTNVRTNNLKFKEQDDQIVNRFGNFQSLIENLSEQYVIGTQQNILSCKFSNDSTKIITVLKESDEEFSVILFCTESYQMTFSITLEGDYIKAKEVSQNKMGNLFAISYIEDEVFKITVFNKTDILLELDVNEMINLDERVIPIDSVADPMINTVFIDESTIFVVAYHHSTMQMWHFTYSIIQKQFKVPPKKTNLDCGSRNFPFQSFYDNKRSIVHVFFRQGQTFAFSTNVGNQNYVYQDITDFDLGEMTFYNDQILIVKSSDVIDFYNIEEEHDDHHHDHDNQDRQQAISLQSFKFEWHKIHTLQHEGFVFNTQGTNQFHVICDDLIYFYEMVQEGDHDGEHHHPTPKLKNSMQNYMNCNWMLIDKMERFCLTYKCLEPDMKIFKQRFNHGFLENADNKSREGCSGDLLTNHNCFLISDDNLVIVLDEKNLEILNKIEVPLPISDTNEVIEIINIKISQNQMYLAVLSGKLLPKEIEEIHYLHVYQIHSARQLELINEIKVPDKYNSVSKSFEFLLSQKNVREILFLTKQYVLTIDFFQKSFKEKIIQKFNNCLSEQPDYLVFNQSQETAIVASNHDVLWINLNTKEEVDIDDMYYISSIKALHHYDNKFYVLSNKYKGKLGYFLLELDVEKPIPEVQPKFIVRWINGLEIGDASLTIINLKREDLYGKVEKKREIVVSYKSMYSNQFVIFVIDIQDQLFQYWFEMYQLWESPIKALMNSSNDIIIMNKDGLSCVPLGNTDKKQIKNSDGVDRMVHSLESCNYLKIEDTNHIHIIKPRTCANTWYIQIEEQFINSDGETQFDELYGIVVHEMSLIEVIIIQSIFSCKLQTEIIKLIQLQPDPSLFFKSFMELDNANMVSLLSFDSRVTSKLLSDLGDFKEDNEGNDPIFYKIRYIKKENESLKDVYTTGLDIALNANQISAANMIVDYIIKYQNSYVYLFIFNNNLKNLLEKGIKVFNLFESDIFCHQFEYEDWPTIHQDNETKCLPYNESIFQLRGKYKKAFKQFEGSQDQIEIEEHDDDDGSHHQIVCTKVYKIKYTINVLPGLITNSNNFDENEYDLTFLELLAETEDHDIFESKIIKDYLNFSWDNYGYSVHYLGAFIHLIYILTFSMHLSAVYMYRNYTFRNDYCTAMAICLIYPAIYDGLQCTKIGFTEYMSDMWNWMDQAHIWFGFANIVCQRFTTNILSIPAQFLMITVIFIMLLKTFFFLRIFEDLSFLVKMLSQVIYDLKSFMIFFIVICYMFSMLLAIIDLDNFEFSEIESTRASKAKGTYPSMEYKYLGKFLGHFCTVIRLSIGDFQFDQVNKMDNWNTCVYWVLWYIIVTITCIVFLNFIIAEVSASYQNVKDTLDVLVMKEKATLIHESEEMLKARFGKNQMDQWKHLFPKYIICREQED